jgi:hypothetical protein
MPAAPSLMSDALHSAPSDRRYGFQQMSSLGIPMQRSGDLGYTFGQVRSGPRHCTRNLRQHLLRCGSECLSRQGEEFTCSHSDERQEMLCGLIFRLGFRGKLSQVFHHGIGIDLANRADLLLSFEFGLEGALTFEFFLAFSFAEKAANHIADGAEPTFSFEFGFVLELGFEFLFAFARIFIFEFGLDQFTLRLISHDVFLLQRYRGL